MLRSIKFKNIPKIYWLYIIIGFIILLFTFLPFSSIKQGAVNKIMQDKYIQKVQNNIAHSLCSAHGLLRLNICIDLSINSCLGIVEEQLNNCVYYNMEDLPSIIDVNNSNNSNYEGMLQNWQGRIKSCTERASLSMIKNNKTLKELSCIGQFY